MTLALAALAGALSWTLLEYGIHRWLGHDKRLTRRTPFGHEHTAHHSRGDYFSPTVKKLGAAALALALVAPPAILALGVAHGLAYALGLVAFYGVYEVTHRMLHIREGRGLYARWARRHHFHHHFHDPASNHGVTSPLWDIVFGTRAEPGTIVVPERLAMRWLKDPETGAIRSDLPEGWVVRPAARKPA
jgi:sterol desaturase/sphingolipid hydroxylase (fatty acid hydroxylase superfamily)